MTAFVGVFQAALHTKPVVQKLKYISKKNHKDLKSSLWFRLAPAGLQARGLFYSYKRCVHAGSNDRKEIKEV